MHASPGHARMPYVRLRPGLWLHHSKVVEALSTLNVVRTRVVRVLVGEQVSGLAEQLCSCSRWGNDNA